jgi:Cu+-exporting ATPase
VTPLHASAARPDRRSLAEGATNKDDIVPVKQNLADVSVDRMRQPAGQHPNRTGSGPSATVLDKTFTDPVCGMTVDPAKTPHLYQHQKRTYYFCSANCRTKFAADPMQYLAAKAAPAQAVPKGTIYTCPMHPQIRQVGPGNCPICGMTLEPVKATAEVGENRELIDMTRRFWSR